MMLSRRVKLLVGGLFILWTFFVLASFYAVQKPFSGENALAVGRALLDLLVAGWLILVALALGTWFLQRFLPVELPLVEASVLGTGLGLGALGLLGLALGLAGLFRPAVAYGVTIVLSAISGPQAIRLIRRGRQWRLDNRPNLLTTLYLSMITVFTLLVALLPPTDWDGLFYHLTGPKLYLQAGGIAGGIDIPHLSFPSLMEMLYTWAMLLRGDIAARLLHTVFGLLLAGLVYLTAHRFLNRRAAWPAVLIFASMPMVSTLAGWAYNDLALAFYQLAGLYSIIKWRLETCPERSQRIGDWGLEDGESDMPQPQGENRHPLNDTPAKSPIRNSQFPIQNSASRWLILSGIFAGLGMGLKYTGFVTPLAIGGLILWQAYRLSSVRRQVSSVTAHIAEGRPHVSLLPGLADFALFSVATFLVALPWYAKNLAFTGNPVYPFLFDLFGGRYWDSFRAGWYAAAGTGIGFRPATLLALPWLLTLGVRDANYWDGRTGPLLLLFLPLVLFVFFFARSREGAEAHPTALSALLVYPLVYFAFWALGVIWSRSLWQSRLLLPALVALAPVAGWVWAGLARFDLPGFSLRRFINIAVGLALALTVVDVGLLTLKIDPLPYLAGLETRDEYLTRRLGAHYAAMQQIDEVLPPEAVVVFLWEPRSYYCRRDCRPDSILDRFPHLVHQYDSAEAIARAWLQAGVTHVLVHRLGLDFVLQDSPEGVDTSILTELESNWLRPVFDVAGAYQLYRLEPVSQAGQ